MKRLVMAVSLLSIMVISCSKATEPVTESTPEKETNVMLEEPKPEDAATAVAANASPEQEGENLLKGMDCLACHKVDAKLVGPSFQDIAAKYTDADIDLLASKIIDGGQGNWGNIPMTAHAGLSQDNAKLMVKYILAQKKK